MPYPGRRARQDVTSLLVLSLITIAVLGSIGTWLPGIAAALGVLFSPAQQTQAACPSLSTETSPIAIPCLRGNPGNAPISVGANQVPNLSLPKKVTSSVDSLIGSGGVTQESPDNLTLFNNGIIWRLLGNPIPHDILLARDHTVLSSWSLWSVEAQAANAWVPLVPSASNFTLLGTNSTGTFVLRTMSVGGGGNSGTLQIAYKATSVGPFDWDLVFTPNQAGNYRLTYSLHDVPIITPSPTLPTRDVLGFGAENYTFVWDDMPSWMNTTVSSLGRTLLLTADMGVLSAGATVRIDPSIVNDHGLSSLQAAGYTFQRKVFYEPNGGYYFVFYYDNIGVGYRSSRDGLTWSNTQYMPPGWPSYYDPSTSSPFVMNSGRTVAVVTGQLVQDPFVCSSAPCHRNGNIPLVYAVGTITGPNISWQVNPTTGTNIFTAYTLSRGCTNTAATTCSLTLAIRYVSMAFAPNGTPQFSFNFYANGPLAPGEYGTCPGASSVESDVGVVFQGGFTFADCENDSFPLRSTPLPVDSQGDVQVVYQYHGNSPVQLKTRIIQGSSFLMEGPEYVIEHNAQDNDMFSTVTDTSLGTHIVYVSGTDGNITYAYKSPTGQWSYEKNILSPFNGVTYTEPTITVDDSTNDLYALAFGSCSCNSSLGSWLLMNRKPLTQTWGSQTWTLITSPSQIYNPAELSSNLVSFSGTNSSWVSAVWTSVIGFKQLEFVSIPVQTVWSPFASPSDPWDGNGVVPYGEYFQNLGEYVSTSSGLLTVQQTDLSVPGRGLDLSITRVYTEPPILPDNAHNYESFPYAPLGKGWQLNLPWIIGANSRYIHLLNGEGYKIPSSFWTGPTSSFENHQGENFRLIRNLDGSIVLYDKSSVAYSFDSNSLLKRVSDPTGNNITITYGNPNYPNYISCITDTVSRAYEFAYWPSNSMLQSISQVTGTCSTPGSVIRTVSYTYNVAGYYVLSSEIDPAGRITTYSYNSQAILSQITYPTQWYSQYTYTPFAIGTDSNTYRVTKQLVGYGPATSQTRVRELDYGYTNGIGEQVGNSTVTAFNGTSTAPVSFTSYSFSFAGAAWNVSDSNHNLLRGVLEKFGSNGEPSQETVLVSDGQGHLGSYTNYYSYDLWGNRIYSHESINPITNSYHERFASYYNNGLPAGFYAFGETFHNGNMTLPDNNWLIYNGTWRVQNASFNGTSPAYNTQNQQSFFSWSSFSNPNVSLTASVYITKPMVSSDARVGLIAHYPGTGLRKWALVFHNAAGQINLSLLDENVGSVTWVAERACSIFSYNTWYTLNFTISGRLASGSATVGGNSCNVSGSFSSNDITGATGIGLYAGGYSSLFSNVFAKTVTPGLTGTSFSNSFSNGAPGTSIHGAVSGVAELQNGPGSSPVETYYNYTSWGGVSQVKHLYVSGGGSTWLIASTLFDKYGNPVTVTDPRGNQTIYGYSPKYQYAYLTSVNQTLVPGGALVSRRYGYNFTTGAVSSSVDPNGSNTTYTYDKLVRLTRVSDPVGFSSYSYNDQANYVNITNENSWKTQQIYDGLARLSTTDRFLAAGLTRMRPVPTTGRIRKPDKLMLSGTFTFTSMMLLVEPRRLRSRMGTTRSCSTMTLLPGSVPQTNRGTITATPTTGSGGLYRWLST